MPIAFPSNLAGMSAFRGETVQNLLTFRSGGYEKLEIVREVAGNAKQRQALPLSG
jgi:hypothetical protein